MAALNPSETARLLAHFRGTRMFVPVLLAALCGLRRGEIAALRWASIDLSRCELSVLESAEQTAKGVRFKETKSGRARTVALSTLVVEELRSAAAIRQSLRDAAYIEPDEGRAILAALHRRKRPRPH